MILSDDASFNDSILLDSVGSLADEGEKFLTGFLFVAEAAEHG